MPQPIKLNFQYDVNSAMSAFENTAAIGRGLGHHMCQL